MQLFCYGSVSIALRKISSRMQKRVCLPFWLQIYLPRYVATVRSEWIPDDHLGSIVKLLSPRDKILTMLLVETGFRLDDVMHVRAWQLSRGVLAIKEMKTGKLRSVPISEDLILAYRRAFPSSHRRGERSLMLSPPCGEGVAIKCTARRTGGTSGRLRAVRAMGGTHTPRTPCGRCMLCASVSPLAFKP